jgi:L-ascorbate metabolism protein UlaG (beta-lactamase superfamily)
MWMIESGVVLLALILLVVGWVILQFRRFRRFIPKPNYRQTQRATNPSTWPNDDVTVAWVGHSTLYISLYGVRILTDPVFSHRIGVSLVGLKVGLKRHTSPALRIEDVVGQVDIIILSHAHMDHFDLPTLKRLAAPTVQVVTAKGTGQLLRRMPFGRVTELGEGDTLQLRAGVVITTVPVRHWGARFPWNKDYGWTGYVIQQGDVRILYAGDTAYTPAFQQLQDQPVIDIACMPIGAYAPTSFQGAHCTPEQAWQMFVDSGARWMVPIHWDTFVLSQEPVREPIERLLQVAGADADRVIIRNQGDVFHLSKVKQHSV